MRDDDLEKRAKYRIRLNADGEEELYYDEDADGGEAEFEIPEFLEDDEEAAIMTPEQLAEREEARRREAERRKAENAALIAKVRKLLADGDYAGATSVLDSLYDVGAAFGEAAVLKLRAVTNDLNDFSSSEISSLAEDIQKNASEDEKKELGGNVVRLKKEMVSLKEKEIDLNEKNETGKGERRAIFLKKRAQTGYTLGAIIILFLISLSFSGYFTSIMHSVNSLKYVQIVMVLLIVSGVLFIAMLVAAKFFWKYAWLVKLNEKNSTTQLGRDYEDTVRARAAIEAVLAAIGEGNDLSR